MQMLKAMANERENMIELNVWQKIAGFIFAGLILCVSMPAGGDNLTTANVIGLGISAVLVIWCLYKKKADKQ